MEYSQPPETGLADDLNSFIQWIPATRGQRFLNYLIDNLLMRFGLSFATGFLMGLLLGAISPDFAYDLFSGGTSMGLLLFSYAIALFNYLIYYTFCEKVFKGYTLGKLITGTKAIREDGGELTFRNAILRTLSRMVPFEALSAFGDRPWHDSWTGTQVIQARP